MHPALFLDRDGVIIDNRVDYVRRWTDVEILPQALPALARASSLPYKVVIITNQSAVGRGLVPLAQAEAINRLLVQVIESAGGRVDGVFMCPHAPQERCACRKPKPGLLLQAATRLAIDLPASILIGDALSDLQAGLQAGLRQVALVRTGRGAEQERLPQAAAMPPFPVFDHLAQALDALIQSE